MSNKVAVLHSRLSGYFAACLSEYKSQSDSEMLVYAWPKDKNAPFSSDFSQGIGKIHNRYDYSTEQILDKVRAFKPDVLLMSGWIDRGYCDVAKVLKRSGVPVVAGCDTQWEGSLRQNLAGVTARMHVNKFIDVMWVTGERQAVLARALGYKGDNLWTGYYACDWVQFSENGATPIAERLGDPYFLFVGRYVEEKGLDTLLEAYEAYREAVDNPWDLRCAGAGPLEPKLEGAGVTNIGFVQPKNLPFIMQNASAFILPSRKEPWGVVAQEAAASGLPLILSDSVGAGVHLLQPGFNGYFFDANSQESLVNRMIELHSKDLQALQTMSDNSRFLSSIYTPERWSYALRRGLEILRK